jgi:plastocyanin
MSFTRVTTAVALISVLTFATGSFVHSASSHAGVTIVVRMTGGADGYRFSPANISAHIGDVVRFINVSGGPHNVSFWADSIPAGAAASLQKNMQQTIDALEGVMLSGPKETYTVSLAGLRPGTYRYYCAPHLAVGMVGRITVRP